MTIAGSLILFAIGAILKFAVTATVSGVDLGIVGIILMVVGAIGFVVGLTIMVMRRRTGVVSHVEGPGTHTTYVSPTNPDDPHYL